MIMTTLKRKKQRRRKKSYCTKTMTVVLIAALSPINALLATKNSSDKERLEPAIVTL